MYVYKTGVYCPLCGKEMKAYSGSFYYEGNLGVIGYECGTCNLEIKEYNHRHGFERGEAGSYFKMYDILKNRIIETVRRRDLV